MKPFNIKISGVLVNEDDPGKIIGAGMASTEGGGVAEARNSVGSGEMIIKYSIILVM